MSRLGLLGAFALAAAFVLVSLAVLPSFGLAWDEGLGDLFFGHRYLSYALGGDPAALDFGQRHPQDGDGHAHPDLFRSPLRLRPWEHWPVMATLSAASCQLLARRLGWLDPVDAHHLAAVLTVALLVPLLVLVAERAWPGGAAWTAALALLLHPRFLAAAWTDLKDTGAAVFITAALLLAWRGLSEQRMAPLLLAGAVAGLGLGTKANTLFLPLTIVAWWLIARPGMPVLGRRQVCALGLGAGLAVAIFFLSWPYLWAAPFERLAENFRYFTARATAGSPGELPWPNPWPGLLVVVSWPVATLPLLGLGAWDGIRALRQRRPALEGLALLAFLLPLARLSLPGAVSFDGYRHALELVPAAALLTGAGAHHALRRGARPWLVAILTVAPVVEVVAVHPFEMAHAGPLVGGVAGARRLGLPGIEDYWATSYRRGYRWIEEHAEPEAAVAAAVAEHLLFLEGPMRLAPGRTLVRASSPFRPDPGPAVLAGLLAAASQRPVYVLCVDRREWRGPVVQFLDRLPAVYVEGPAGRPLFRIVRLDPSTRPPDAGQDRSLSP